MRNLIVFNILNAYILAFKAGFDECKIKNAEEKVIWNSKQETRRSCWEKTIEILNSFANFSFHPKPSVLLERRSHVSILKLNVAQKKCFVYVSFVFVFPSFFWHFSWISFLWKVSEDLTWQLVGYRLNKMSHQSLWSERLMTESIPLGRLKNSIWLIMVEQHKKNELMFCFHYQWGFNMTFQSPYQR